MELTPVQQRTLDELMRRDPLPVFERALVEDLRADLERRVKPLVDTLREGETVWLSKGKLSDLHARCEGLFLANHLGEGEFELGWQLALGNLVHRAIGISVNLPRRSDAELVEAALTQLRRDDPGFDEFCLGLGEADLAALESEAVERVLLFRSTFPPLQKAWSPAVEPSLKVVLCGERVVLSARPDLLLGGDDPEEPMRGRRIVIELKTGQDRPEHDDDLRFYALAATLRLGVPPFRVATVFLDDAAWRMHEVTPDLLEAAVRRIGGGSDRIGALLGGEEPRLRPGPWCGWCPRAETCPESPHRAEA